MLDADEEQNGDTDEEDQVGRDCDSDDAGCPSESSGENSDDESENACDQPPDLVSFTQAPPAEHLDDHREGDEGGDYAENLTSDAHRDVTLASLNEMGGLIKAKTRAMATRPR